MTTRMILLALLASTSTAVVPAAGAEPALSGTDAVSPAPGVKVASMSVDIWPEYDKPSVLVIYKGSLAAPLSTPTDFSILIPSGAQLGMVGGIDKDGRHIHAAYQTHDRDDGMVEVSYKLDVPTFYMEFYYDPLGGGDQRDFTYSVVSPYDVGTLIVNVQQPRRVEGFHVTPYTPKVVQDDNGFEYFVIQSDDVPAGSATPVSITYRKTDRAPSVQPQSMAMTDTGGGGTPRQVWLLWAAAAALLVGVGGYMLFGGSAVSAGVEGRKERAPVRPRSGPPNPELSEARFSEPDERARFCTQCGSALEPEDHFCGRCGRATKRTADMSLVGL